MNENETRAGAERQRIAEQTADYLARGQRVTEVPPGASAARVRGDADNSHLFSTKPRA